MAEGKAGLVGQRQSIVELRHLNLILKALEAEALEGLSRGGPSSSSHLEHVLMATGEHTRGREDS